MYWLGLSEDWQQIKEESAENRGGMVLIGGMGYLVLRVTRCGLNSQKLENKPATRNALPAARSFNDDKRSYF